MWARYAFGLLMSAPLFQAGKAHAEVFTEGESVSYSESLTVEGFYHGLTGGDYTPGGEVSFTHNRGVLGYRYGNFETGVIGRYDYSAEYDPDAFEFLYKGINGLPLAEGDYDLDISAKHTRAFGFRFGYAFEPVSNLKITPRLSALWTDEILEGYTRGDVNLQAPDVLSGDLYIDYYYDDDLLRSSRSVDAPNGFGWALDLEINWKPTQKSDLTVRLDDLWSEIRWEDTPGTRVSAEGTDIQAGNVSLNGTNTFTDYSQSYDTRVTVIGGYQATDKWSASQKLLSFQDRVLATTSVGYNVTPELKVSASTEWKTGAWGGAIAWRDLELGIVTDQLDLATARYVDINLRWSASF